MKNTRYSKTRITGAQHTAATKLTKAEHDALHWLAVETQVSDYEYLRQLVQAAVGEREK